MDPSNINNNKTPAPPDDASDLVWGADGIGAKSIARPARSTICIASARSKARWRSYGHRTFVGSRKRLRNIISTKLKAPGA